MMDGGRWDTGIKRSNAPMFLYGCHMGVEVIIQIELVALAGLRVFAEIGDVDCCGHREGAVTLLIA